MSPTSNQLARWFSPELLAKAQAGKLPPIGQAAMTLEEFERNMSNDHNNGGGGGGSVGGNNDPSLQQQQSQQQRPIGIKRN